jgi:hypothetical protein
MTWTLRLGLLAMLLALPTVSREARAEELLADDAGHLEIFVINPFGIGQQAIAETAFEVISGYSDIRITVSQYDSLIRFDSLSERRDTCSRFEDGEKYPVLVRRVPGRKDATFFVRAGWVVSLETGKCFRTPPDLERLIESAERLASGTRR